MRKTFVEWIRHIELGRKEKEAYELKVRRNNPPPALYMRTSSYYQMPNPYIYM